MKKCLILFAKYPVPGKVKTRLALAFSKAEALEIYKAMLADTLETIRKSGADNYVYCYPDTSIKDFKKFYAKDLVCRGQRGRGLGAKMKNAFKDVFKDGYDRAVIVGSDIPQLTTDILRKAFEQLKKRAVAIGPALDGGYYLIGFNKENYLPEIFSGVSWGTADVFNETMNILKQHRRQTSQLPMLRDLDHIEDVKYYFKHLKRKNGHLGKFLRSQLSEKIL